MIKSAEQDWGYQLNTNKVIRYQGDQELTFFVPAYMRLHLKNFQQLNLTDLDAEIGCTMVLTIWYEGLPMRIVSKIKEKAVLLFSHSPPVFLGNSQNPNKRYTHDRTNKTLRWVIRKGYVVAARPTIFWSPFELVDLVLSVSLKSIRFEDELLKKMSIKFNLMDHPNTFLKLSYTEEGTFGVYHLAQSKMYAQFTNNPKARTPYQYSKNNNSRPGHYPLQKFIENAKKQLHNENQNHQVQIGSVSALIQQDRPLLKQANKTQHFQFGHFVIPIYKKPLPTLAMIFFPIWLLGVINIGIFFQDTVQSRKRALNVATLMISYVALIPTIRDNLPPSWGLIFIEYLVYLESLTTFLSMIEFIMVRNDSTTVQRYNQYWKDQPLLVICIVITGFNVITVFILYVLHVFLWEPSYKRTIDMETIEKFNHTNWRNLQCDRYFQQYTDLPQYFKSRKDSAKVLLEQ